MKKIILFLLFSLSGFAQELCFVQLTDTHFGSPEHAARARAAVEAINKLPFDVQFVVVTGDVMADNITNENAVAEALDILGRLKVPTHFVAGNHDVKTNNLSNTVATFFNRFGPLTSRQTYGGVECVFAYTEPLARGFSVVGYDPLVEVAALLDECVGRPVIMFHHTASISDFYNNRLYKGWKNEQNRALWHSLLQGKGVDAVVAGHFHRGELHWIGDIPVYVAPSIAGYWGRQASFRIYEYRNGHLSYRTGYINE